LRTLSIAPGYLQVDVGLTSQGAGNALAKVAVATQDQGSQALSTG
jgi:hypothetical protein